jgi:hypothetical protein
MVDEDSESATITNWTITSGEVLIRKGRILGLSREARFLQPGNFDTILVKKIVK